MNPEELVDAGSAALDSLPQAADALFSADSFRLDPKVLAEHRKQEATRHKQSEQSKENDSRLRREEAEHAARLSERRLILRCGIVLVVIVVVVDLCILGFSRESEDRSWARTILTTLVSGFVGFYLSKTRDRDQEK